MFVYDLLQFVEMVFQIVLWEQSMLFLEKIKNKNCILNFDSAAQNVWIRLSGHLKVFYCIFQTDHLYITTEHMIMSFHAELLLS